MKKIPLLFLLLLVAFISLSQNDIKVYPIHWFTGMKNPKLQLILHGDNVGAFDKATINYPAVAVKKVTKAENKNYLFVDLAIAATARPGNFNLSLSGSGIPSRSITYELRAKSTDDGKTRVQGVTSADVIYLLMPDRFANGDPSNDFFADMRDTQHDRNNPFDRHGGDLQGVTDHLDYFNDLGITTIWMTPVVENDMSRTQEGGSSRSTYHGYAFTDQYNIDRRFGGNEAYKKMVNAAHAKGLKVIQDAVYNHVGNDHWSIRDMPMKDWVNQWPTYTNTSYKDLPLIDPYASAIDKKISVDGWFTPFLVDLNQRNPYVSNFLIQYAIWATEEFGVDGWRVDTYFYCDPVFLNKINDALAAEFPKLTVFGETLVPSVISTAYFSQNNLNVPFKHNCPGITDLPVTVAMLSALNERFGWSEGVNRLYGTLTSDFLYKNPNHNCIFLDNHDLDRFYSIVGENFNKYKMGINWLFTLRGIPEIYYGTEILMKNFRNPTDAEVRRDFPGGWKGDSVNKFTAAGRTQQENDAFNYVSKLAHFRKTSSAITGGKLMQYLPQDAIYIYFRYNNNQTIMVVSNTGEKESKIDWKRFEERTKGFTQLKDAVTGETKSMTNFSIQPGESFVFELLK